MLLNAENFVSLRSLHPILALYARSLPLEAHRLLPGSKLKRCPRHPRRGQTPIARSSPSREKPELRMIVAFGTKSERRTVPTLVDENPDDRINAIGPSSMAQGNYFWFRCPYPCKIVPVWRSCFPLFPDSLGNTLPIIRALYLFPTSSGKKGKHEDENGTIFPG